MRNDQSDEERVFHIELQDAKYIENETVEMLKDWCDTATTLRDKLLARVVFRLIRSHNQLVNQLNSGTASVTVHERNINRD